MLHGGPFDHLRSAANSAAVLAASVRAEYPVTLRTTMSREFSELEGARSGSCYAGTPANPKRRCDRTQEPGIPPLACLRRCVLRRLVLRLFEQESRQQRRRLKQIKHQGRDEKPFRPRWDNIEQSQE